MINNDLNKQLEMWLKNNEENIVSDWIELAKIPSVKSKAVEGAPFGIDCKNALVTAAAFFERYGFESKISQGNTYAICSFGNSEKKIGIFSHSDVVPVGEGWIYTEPFEPVVKDGTLIGRGVEDNKSGIIAALSIFRFMKENGIKLKNKIELFIGSDEECGMNDMKEYLLNETLPDVSLVPDADFPCSVGEKGIYHFMAESKEKFENIISINGGLAYNIVLDSIDVIIPFSKTVLDELNEKAANSTVSFALTDNDNIILTFKGVAKHASIPEGSVNAALVAAEFLSECDFISKNDKNILTAVKEALSCYYGKGLNIEHNDNIFGKTTCVNGMCRTVDGKLRISFDVRYGDTVSSEELEEKIDSRLDKLGFITMNKDNRPGFFISEDNIFPAIFENIYRQITGEKLERVTMAGGTYARRLKNAFSIGTSIIKKDRTTPVLVMPDGHGGAHQCDECIDIEGFFEAVKVLFNYILACDENLG